MGVLNVPEGMDLAEDCVPVSLIEDTLDTFFPDYLREILNHSGSEEVFIQNV